MNTERVVHITAGFFTLPSLSLWIKSDTPFVGKNLLWFTAVAGLNSFQDGFTDSRSLNSIPAKSGIKRDACRA